MKKNNVKVKLKNLSIPLIIGIAGGWFYAIALTLLVVLTLLTL